MALPTRVGYSIVCVPNMSTPNLSLAQNRKVQESVRGNGHTVFTENVGTDDKQIVEVMPESVYRHTGLHSENNIVIRKERFPSAHIPGQAPASLKNFHSRTWEDEKKTATPFVHSDGTVRRRGYILMGTSKSHVQPMRTGSFDMWGFAENPILTPGCDLGIHLVSAVRKSIGSTYGYRLREREEQWYHVTVPAINALTDAGINVQLFGDPNWLNPNASRIKGEITRFVNTKYSIIWFIQSPKANWGLHLVKPGIKHVDNPSDHNAEIAHVEAMTNSRYVVPGDVPVGPVDPAAVDKWLAAWPGQTLRSDQVAGIRSLVAP